MPIIDTRDDRKINEAEVFYHSAQMETELNQICQMSCQALRFGGTEWDVAKRLKAKLEAIFDGQWAVIVGKAFGAFLTVDARNFVHFRIGRTHFVLYKF